VASIVPCRVAAAAAADDADLKFLNMLGLSLSVGTHRDMNECTVGDFAVDHMIVRHSETAASSGCDSSGISLIPRQFKRSQTSLLQKMVELSSTAKL